MKHERNLTEGSISKALIALALPIMGTSFIQMAYNMIDMIWIGRLGSISVAAVGVVGFFTWLAMAFIMLPKIGAEIGVSQSLGKGDKKGVKRYVRHTIQLIVFLALVYSLVLILFRDRLIGFFNLEDPEAVTQARDYFTIITAGLIFYFVNPVFTGILNGQGDSKSPFKINVIGLVMNILLDPVLIFGLGPIPAMGVRGAAFATVFSQLVVSLFFISSLFKKGILSKDLDLFKMPDWGFLRAIIRLGLPAGLQSGLFTIFAMVIARIVSQWGDTAIAVQKVGSQVEAISWMTAGGFSTALGTFVGQNFGAKKWERIYKGYFIGLAIVGGIGIGATLLLVLGARPVFFFFIPGEEAGIAYLRILGLSQLFMCMEIATTGAFNGLGRTVPPSIVGIVMNALRIPSALILSKYLGLNGVWWSISKTSVFKGMILTTWFITLLVKKYRQAGNHRGTEPHQQNLSLEG